MCESDIINRILGARRAATKVLCALAAFAVLTVPVLAAPDDDQDAQWSDAVARAQATERSIVVFSRPENCRKPGRRLDPCEAFSAIVRHPANQRRLKNLVFLVRPSDGPSASVTVYGPDSKRVISWSGIPDVATFGRMLTNLQTAAPHLLAAWHASLADDPSGHQRALALALLALGDEPGGRAQLESLGASSNPEDQQLATIWLFRLDAMGQKTDPPIDALERLARDGATDSVRIDAWMAIGDLASGQGRGDEASVAYAAVIDLAPERSLERDAALAAMQRVTALESPVIGLGSPGAIVAGRRTIQPRRLDKRVSSVEYRLDERLGALATRAPFIASVNFGRLPKRQRLEVITRDAAGKELHRSGIIVNERTNAFSVQIVEPSGDSASGAVDVEVGVRTPRGRNLASLVVEWNGARLARLTTPPYRTRIEIVEQEQGVLRAVATLDDGSELEDVRLLNAGSMLLESGVHLVEVPVYFDRAVGKEDITVKEDGMVRPVDRLVLPAEAPLLIALMIDTSSSMSGDLLDLQEAAIEFVEKNLGPADRVMVVAFDTALRILWPTSDRTRIESAILSIDARGATSLNDAMVNVLLQFQATGSRRALIVFTDGMDNSSSFTSGDVADIARRGGVPVYVFAHVPELPTNRAITRNRMPAISPAEKILRAQAVMIRKMATTGGQGFQVKSLDTLDSIFAEIGADLRKQLLVIYRPDPAGKEWRSLEVLSGPRTLRAPSHTYVMPDTSTSRDEP